MNSLLNEMEDENLTHSEFYFKDLKYYNESFGAKIYLALLINLLQLSMNIKERIDITLDIYLNP